MGRDDVRQLALCQSEAIGGPLTSSVAKLGLGVPYVWGKFGTHVSALS